jgi:hypothetical protein
MAKITKLEKLTFCHNMEILIEEAKLNMVNNVEMAKHCLIKVIDESEIERHYIIKSHAYRLYGEVLAENYALSIGDIEKKYFAKSLMFLEKYAKMHNMDHLIANLDDNDVELSQASQEIVQERAKDVEKNIRESSCVFDVIAKYHDREYVYKDNYIKSAEYKAKKKTYAQNKEKIGGLTHLLRTTDRKNEEHVREINKSLIVLKKSLTFDEAEMEAVEKERKNAAKNAL